MPRKKTVRPGKDAKLEQIMTSAVRLFAERGYRATTVEDIMDTIGTTGAAFYYYFKSKEELLQTISDDALNLVVAELERTLEMKLDPPEALRRIISTHTRVIGSRPYLCTVLFHETRDLSPRLAKRVADRERQYTMAIRDIYKQGVADGSFLDEDPEIVVNGLLGMSNWTYKWIRPRIHRPEQIAELFGDMALQAVTVGGAGSKAR
jgi:TetR/AcrR family transcriptional regulator, cholesterol catabolism regulator